MICQAGSLTCVVININDGNIFDRMLTAKGKEIQITYAVESRVTRLDIFRSLYFSELSAGFILELQHCEITANNNKSVHNTSYQPVNVDA